MKKFEVTLFLLRNPDANSNSPKTIQSVHVVEAENSFKAYRLAEQKETSLLSIWNYTVKEIKK